MGGNRNIGHKLAFRLQNSRSVSRSMLLLLIICSIVLWICGYKITQRVGSTVHIEAVLLSQDRPTDVSNSAFKREE